MQGGVELVPTIYRSTTLDTANSGASVADPTTGNPVYVPINQGILFADLSAPGAPATAAFAGYYETTTLPSTLGTGLSAMMHSSPFTSFDGAILAPGTEKVQGPDNNLPTYVDGSATKVRLVDYFRIGNVNDTGTNNTQPSKTLPGQMYNRSGSLSYRFDVNYKYTSAPKIDFGVSQIDYTLPTQSPDTAYQRFLVTYGFAGLPSQPAGTTTTATTTAQSLAELQVSFLWQNNFARDNNGFPLAADGSIANAANGGSIVPEPDVFRLDYATRSLLNIALGASVYDAAGGLRRSRPLATR